MGTGSSKIYTRTGDKGKTSLIGGTRVSKAHARLEAYGTLDELNSTVGWLIAEAKTDFEQPRQSTQLAQVTSLLSAIQNELFDVGSHLACEDVSMRTKLPAVGGVHIEALEKAMDEFSSELEPLKNFILPGGTKSASAAHLARTICRRAERAIVALNENDDVENDIVVYVNRLSDFFFVLARHLNRLRQEPETIWAPRA